VGPATAEAARRAGFQEVEAPAASSDAESLLAALRARAPEGGRFLFVRGASAREVLPRGLRASGARVDEAVVYRTEPAPVDAPALRAALVRGELDALTFTSASAARRFAELLDEPARRAATGCVIAAIGGTTAEALREHGLPPDVVAEQAGMRALVESLAGAFGPRGSDRGGRG
jgi:uroporphyrinogen-III synthase